MEADAVEMLADDLARTMPEPSEHAIEAAETSEAESQGPVDRDGRQFDPSLHCVDADGSPKLTARGFLRLKRQSNKAMQNAESQTLAPTYQAAAVMAGTIFALGVSIGGDEWSPKIDKSLGINEQEQMIEAWRKYFEAKGIQELPPWLEVAVVMGGYVLPRLAAPKTRSRLGNLGLWLKSKYVVWRAKRNGLPVEAEE